MADVLLATAAVMPKPDPESHLLREALFDLSITAQMAGWDDPTVDWAGAELVLIRTPWNYVHHCDEFLAWAKRVDGLTKLQNPVSVVSWNAHKSYLLDLQRAGVHVLPTQIIPKGAGQVDFDTIGELVIKPAIGVGAHGAMRGPHDDPAMKQRAAELAKTNDVLVQPYADSVASRGEVSLIYFDGAYSHAVRKVPKAGDFRVQNHHGGVVLDYAPTAQEFAAAEKALSAAPDKTIYARVDLVDFDGAPALMELELIEPELFLGRDLQASNKLAAAILKLI